MILGAKLTTDGKVEHALAGQIYIGILTLFVLVVFGYATWHGMWFGVLIGLRSLWAVVMICGGKWSQRDHKRNFVRMSNWAMVFLFSVHLPYFTLETIALLVTLGGAIVLCNVAYYNDPRSNQPLMLRAFWRRARAA
jgi:hypothetical protein